MEEVDVEVFRAAGVELRLELLLRVLETRRAVSARHLVYDDELLAVVLLEHLAGVVLGLPPDIHPCGVKVVDAVANRVVDELVGELLVDHVASLLRQAHHAKAEARDAPSVEIDGRDLERVRVVRVRGERVEEREAGERTASATGEATAGKELEEGSPGHLVHLIGPFFDTCRPL